MKQVLFTVIFSLVSLLHYRLLAPPGARSMTAAMRVYSIFQSPSWDIFWQKLNHFWSTFFKNWLFLFTLGGSCAFLHTTRFFLPISVKNCPNLKKYGTVRKIFSRAIIWAQFRYSSSNNSVVIPAYSWSLQPEPSQFQSFDVFSCFPDILVNKSTKYWKCRYHWKEIFKGFHSNAILSP